MRVHERVAYVVSQTARMAWFTGHYLATRRLDGLAAAGKTAPVSAQRRRRSRLVRQALIRGAIDLVRRDLANIAAGHYRLPRDVVPNPLEAIRDLLRYYRDLPRARARRKAGASLEVRDLAADGAYPDYFLRNFHFQTDGYLSRHSAELYDFQVEVLFTGTADAMRREALVPISEFLAGHAGGNAALLDIACGTGGFLATVGHCWANLALSGLDISGPYLARGRRRRGLADTAFIEANAEAIPLADASRDIVTCLYLFHELPRPVRRIVAGEMARVLRPGGRLVLLDSLQLGDTPVLDPALLGFPDNFHEPYFRDYLEQDLAALLAEVGLIVRAERPAYLSKVFVADKPA
ncbi:MAG: methyltransferase domain-containing protein [Proteobacteria bacterium]|nr:methyltransferase domain-containing protein [Pseudomonadota bacterium]